VLALALAGGIASEATGLAMTVTPDSAETLSPVTLMRALPGFPPRSRPAESTVATAESLAVQVRARSERRAAVLWRWGRARGRLPPATTESCGARSMVAM